MRRFNKAIHRPAVEPTRRRKLRAGQFGGQNLSGRRNSDLKRKKKRRCLRKKKTALPGNGFGGKLFGRIS